MSSNKSTPGSSASSTAEAWDMSRYTLSGVKKDAKRTKIRFQYDSEGYEFRLVSAKPPPHSPADLKILYISNSSESLAIGHHGFVLQHAKA
jgi:hypothetical protein